MSLLFTLLLVAHVAVAIAIIVLVLLQHGKGADMGAAFGSGSSGSLFGATGSANFLSRATGVLAALFFVTSLILTWTASNRPTSTDSGVMGTMKDAPAPKGNDVPKSDVPKSDVPKSEPVTPDAPKSDAVGATGSKEGGVPK